LSINIFGIKLSAEVSNYIDLFFIVILALVLIKIVSIVIFDIVLKERRKIIVPKLLKNFINLLVYLVVIFVVFHFILGFELTPIIATSAVMTLVLGFALQDTLGNFFSGLAIHFEPPFQIGDWVKIGNTIGKVQEITWRSVKLITRHFDTVVFPNTYIAKETIINFSKPLQSHAHSFTIGVSYNDSPDHVISVIRGVLSQVEGVNTSIEPIIRLVAFQDFSILYNVRFHYYDYANIERIEGEINRRLWYVFKRENITIPFPIRNIYIHKKSEELSVQNQEVYETIKNIFLFSKMSEDEMKLIISKMKEKYFARGEIIVNQGDEGSSMYIIKEGIVSIDVIRAGGQEIHIKELHKGDFFGEISFLTGDKRSATAKALTETVLYELEREDLHNAIQVNKDIAYKLQEVVMQRKEEVIKAIEDDTLVMEEKIKEEKKFNGIIDKIKKFLFS
jgi:small-conductance mechanosensitive channel/CRP-like cAMP-binding protein